MRSDRRERHGTTIPTTVLLLATGFLLATTLQLYLPNATAQPSITIRIGLNATNVGPGDILNCTIYFNNTGIENSSMAWINVSFSPGLVYTWDTSAVEGGVKTGDYNWTFANVFTSDHSYDILFLVSNNVQDGELMTIDANLDYLDRGTNPMPPSNAIETVTARRPVVTVSKTAESYVVSPGQVFNYTVSFQNSGSRIASVVYVDDTLPWTLTYVNDSSAKIGGNMVSMFNWSFPNVVGTLSFNITVSALVNLTDGMIINNNLKLFYCNSKVIWFPMETAGNTTIIGNPAIIFTKVADKSTAVPGDLLNYTLSISNTGPVSAKEVWINDTVPNGTTYFSSSPSCDSFTNNTCTWTLFDFAPGSRQLHLIVSTNISVPDGFTVENRGYLDYTDAIGRPLGSLYSNDTTTVQASYLDLILQDRNPMSTPYDSMDVDILIRNHSPQPSLKAWLNISFPQEIQYVSDNSATIGGSTTGLGKWEFTNVSQGNHSFTITLEIVSETDDGTELHVDLDLDHTDVGGVALPRITDRITITIQAPVISLETASEKQEYKQSETPAIVVYLNNSGSAIASSVWVDLSVPSSVKYLDDTSSSIGGVRLEEFRFLIEDLDQGEHSFEVSLDLGDIENTTSVDIWIFVNYADSNGDLIAETSEKVSFGVIVPAEEFPLVPIAIVILIAFTMSLGFAFRRESVKYRFLMFIAPLFSRLKRKDVLGHETRGMIRGYIMANPGDHFNAIKDTLNLTNGTLAHHINILERERIIKSIRDGKYRRFFPVGTKIIKRAYPTKIERLILEIVEENPGITQKEIAKQLGISQPTVSYHITKLRKAKRLRTEKHGMSLKHYLEDIEK